MERRPETELELGPQRGSHMVPSEGVPFSMTACLRNLRRLRFPRPMFLYHSGTIDIWRPQAAQIEDYPSGYPRFSALLAAHGSFHLGRRFSHLRARLLLLKQDRLSLLEKQLVEIDEKETTLLHLGCCRSDDNSNRRSVLSEIDCALADYDALLERNQRILSLEAANRRDVSSLQRWVDGNACLAREETAFLARYEDLCTIAPPKDQSVTRAEAWVEDFLIRSYQWFPSFPCGVKRLECTYILGAFDNDNGSCSHGFNHCRLSVNAQRHMHCVWERHNSGLSYRKHYDTSDYSVIRCSQSENGRYVCGRSNVHDSFNCISFDTKRNMEFDNFAEWWSKSYKGFLTVKGSP